MQFCFPRAGIQGNVLLTSKNRPKYFYQCTVKDVWNMYVSRRELKGLKNKRIVWNT